MNYFDNKNLCFHRENNRAFHGECSCNSWDLTDYGPCPFVVNVNQMAKQNENFRTALWTGKHLQMTLMCIPVCGDIGFEVHSEVDQFICIVEGCALIKMGNNRDEICFEQSVGRNCAFFIPAGMWHNIINIGSISLKLYSVYAPPQHLRGTIHKTKAEAERMEINDCCKM